MPDYIPGSDTAFLAWLANFVTYIQSSTHLHVYKALHLSRNLYKSDLF